MKLDDGGDIIVKIVKLFNLGVSAGDVAILLDIELSQLMKMIQENPRLAKAEKIGIKRSNLKVTEALLKAATGHTIKEKVTDRSYKKDGTIAFRKSIETIKDVPPNMTAIRFWLENRDPSWKDSISAAEKDLNITIRVDGKDIVIDKGEEK